MFAVAQQHSFRLTALCLLTGIQAAAELWQTEAHDAVLLTHIPAVSSYEVRVLGLQLSSFWLSLSHLPALPCSPLAGLLWRASCMYITKGTPSDAVPLISEGCLPSLSCLSALECFV